ncbi:MAG: DUF3078 domain-containing protein [Bacteroidales bacterium]
MYWRINIICALSLFSICNLSAQENRRELSACHELSVIIASKFKVPQLNSLPVQPKPSSWKKGTLLQLGFTQTSFSNWSSGGNSSVALNAYVNMYANYALNDLFFENRIQMAYGFIQSFNDRYKKSDDKFIIDSKFGYKAWDHVFASAVFNLKTQMTNGFDYPSNAESKLVSGPFSPAYISLGFGLDYKPVKSISLVLSPLTGNMTMVQKKELRVKYGNDIDQPTRFKLGSQLKVDYNQKIHKDINLSTSATFFSDFFGNPENIKVNWDLFIDTKLNNFFSTSIRTNLIYDDDVLLENNAGELAPRIQFKEILQVGFSYTFGEFKK